MEDLKIKKLDTSNPLNKGVTYEAFLSNVGGKITVDSLLKKHKISSDSIRWLKEELIKTSKLKKILNNKKNK